ncbi:MAG: hypothetical protein LBT53_07685 [Puniceicoccales bacterium]|jgi:hypothetical protein|nr:hypothetical protein [Puniceicoccales bacterium]
MTKKIFTAFAALFTAVFLGGCANDAITYRATLHFEATPRELEGAGKPGSPLIHDFAMPDEIARKNLDPKYTPRRYRSLEAAVATEEHFLDASAVKATYAVGADKWDMVQLRVLLTPTATNRLYAQTITRVQDGGNRLFLFVNGNPVGSLILSEQVKTGALLFGINLPYKNEEELKGQAFDLQNDLRKTILILRKQREGGK